MMHGSPQLSIVIAMKDAAEFIRQCLGSIQRLEFDELEVIIVDDGSTDESSDIVQGCMRNDPRIHLHSQDNSGWAYARNKGLSLAQGEYVMFLDADDQIVTTQLRTIVQTASRHQADIYCFGAGNFSHQIVEASQPDERAPALSCNEELRSGPQTLSRVALEGTWNPRGTQYLVRREFLSETGILFPKGNHFEDNPFTFSLLLKAAKVAGTAEVVLGVRETEDSITRGAVTEQHILSLLQCRHLVVAAWLEAGFPRQIQTSFATLYVYQNLTSQIFAHRKRLPAKNLGRQRSDKHPITVRTGFMLRLFEFIVLSALTKPTRAICRLIKILRDSSSKP